MSVNGLERITDQILSDAKARADVLLETAIAECERITAESAAKAEEIRRRLSEEAEARATALIAETKAMASARKNELLLSRKSQLVEQVFEGAYKEILSLETGKYAELLGGLLASAIYEFCRTDAENRTRYGDDDEDENAAFEVILNKKDRDTCGETVLTAARRRLTGKVPEDALKALMLSQQTKPMQGGLVVRRGPVEYNCSLEMLFTQLRGELRGEVSRTLFVFRGNGI